MLDHAAAPDGTTAGNPAVARTPHTTLLPPGWPQPKGYANGMLAKGRFVVTGGQVGWDEHGRFAADLVGQIRQTLANILAVLASGGAGPEHLVRLTWYVCDMDAYRANLRGVGEAYRATIGKHFPAMAVVEVSRLVEPDALVEIEATAVLPDE